MEVGTKDRSVSGRGIAHAKSDSLVHGGDFSRTDSIIIHRLHRRRVLIIRLGRARRMDRESALWKKKHTGERAGLRSVTPVHSPPQTNDSLRLEVHGFLNVFFQSWLCVRLQIPLDTRGFFELVINQ